MTTTTRATDSTDLAKIRKILRTGTPHANFHVALLGLQTFESLELFDEVQRGLRFSCFSRFQKNTSFSMTTLAELVQITPRTLTRRKEEGRLGPDESDRLVRASRVFGRALELFEGDDEQARRWLLTEARALGGRTPLDLARSEIGAKEVEMLIGRLGHGIPS
jgi:putative toxin-antitoxin system antitoxin component (TIGR02293 family)